jgi:hypothetical protein
MRLGKTFLALSGLLLLAATPSVAEESFLCPKTQRWISVGDTPARVLKKCGQPKLREDVTRDGCTDDGMYCFGKVGERWVYDFGRTYLVRFLLFQDNRLTQIETGGYGDGS